MRLLTPNEQHTLHHRYKQNDLYRQWSPILAMLQRKYDEADAQTLWYQAEQQIVRLRGELSFREQEIAPIYNELIEEALKFDENVRTKEQAQRTAATVMGILLTMLMNAVEKGHEAESFDNEPMCLAVFDVLMNDTFFQNLMNLFFSRSTGYDGKKVVITPSDPMMEKTLLERMDEVAIEETRQMVNDIISRTKGIEALLDKDWPHWEALWVDLLTDTQMMFMMKNKEPRTTDWGINQKMVCNVLGLVKDKLRLTASVKALNDAICKTNVRSYITNHADYGGTDSVFDSTQHDRIKLLIEKHFLSTKNK